MDSLAQSRRQIGQRCSIDRVRVGDDEVAAFFDADADRPNEVVTLGNHRLTSGKRIDVGQYGRPQIAIGVATSVTKNVVPTHRDTLRAFEKAAGGKQRCWPVRGIDSDDRPHDIGNKKYFILTDGNSDGDPEQTTCGSNAWLPDCGSTRIICCPFATNTVPARSAARPNGTLRMPPMRRFAGHR